MATHDKTETDGLSAERIAEPEEIRRGRRALAALGPRLGVARLTEEQRRRLAAQQARQAATGPLGLWAACQRLAAQQPELAEAAGAPASGWEALIARDLQLEQVDAALQPLLTSTRNGQLLLLSALTACNDAIAEAARRAADSGARAVVLGAKFAGPERARAKQQGAARTRQQRKRRAARRAEEQVAVRRRAGQLLLAAERLREAPAGRRAARTPRKGAAPTKKPTKRTRRGE